MSFEDLIDRAGRQIEREATNLEFVDKLARLEGGGEKEVTEGNRRGEKKEGPGRRDREEPRGEENCLKYEGRFQSPPRKLAWKPSRGGYQGRPGRKFSPEHQVRCDSPDMLGNENPFFDAVVIKAALENYTVSRIVVDNGSSVNVIFKKAFDQMKVEKKRITSTEGTLFGFSDERKEVEGKVDLVVTLGEPPSIVGSSLLTPRAATTPSSRDPSSTHINVYPRRITNA